MRFFYYFNGRMGRQKILLPEIRNVSNVFFTGLGVFCGTFEQLSMPASYKVHLVG